MQGGSGDAGNITLDSRFVVLNDSRVIARAVEGNGGNIRIQSSDFLATPQSVVDASSQRGVNGIVDVRGVVSNISGSVYPLPQSYLDKAELTRDRCAKQLQAGRSSRFVVLGRSGLPPEPGGLLPSPLVPSPLETQTIQEMQPAKKQPQPASSKSSSKNSSEISTSPQPGDNPCLKWQLSRTDP